MAARVRFPGTNLHTHLTHPPSPPRSPSQMDEMAEAAGERVLGGGGGGGREGGAQQRLLSSDGCTHHGIPFSEPLLHGLVHWKLDHGMA
jgi:hypothetical protein